LNNNKGFLELQLKNFIGINDFKANSEKKLDNHQMECVDFEMVALKK